MFLLVCVGILLFIFKAIPALAPTSLPFSGNSYSEHTTYYDIATNFATSTPLSKRANATAVMHMEQFVQNTVTQFKADGHFDHLTSEDIAAMNGRKETLQIAYLMASSPHTVSYIFTIYEDTLGAHGNTVFRTFTFNTETGALLPLGDLFKPSSDYLTSLSTLARTELTASLNDPSMTSFIVDGTKPDTNHFQDFFLDNQDLVLLFPAYQVAPYAAGPQTVRIPSSALPDMLSQYP